MDEMEKNLKEIKKAKEYFSGIEFENPRDRRKYKIETFDGIFDWTARSIDSSHLPLCGDIREGSESFSLRFSVGPNDHFIKVEKSKM